MDLSSVNIPAVLVAAISTFAVGGLWYSPLLFGRSWMQEAGLTDEKVKKGNLPLTFGLTFLLAVIIALTFLRIPSRSPSMVRSA